MTEGRDDVCFRMATVEDIDALADLRWRMAIEGSPEAVSREDYIAAYRASVGDELARGRFMAWLAEVDGRAVACTVLIWWPMPPNMDNLHRRRGYVSSVYTHPEYRRMGLARTLMEMLVAGARELGISRLLLNTSRMGRSLYESMGFVVPARGLELDLDQGA